MQGHALEFWDVIADGRHDGVGHAQAGGFAESDFQLRDRPDFAAQAQFADGHAAGRERAVHVGRGDGQGDGQIDGGLWRF